MEAEQINAHRQHARGPRATRPPSCGGIFDFDVKAERLAVVARELEDPKIWDDPQRAQELGKEKKELDGVVGTLDGARRGTGRQPRALRARARARATTRRCAPCRTTSRSSRKTVADLEFRRMFNNPLDPANCFIDIQAGSGGTEAQDWASMLLRMYLRYCERKGYRTEVLEESDGEVAGIKSASIKVEGDYAYGYLRTEIGVHRLVRKSPFDSNARRHTSFASVFVYPGGRRLDRGRHQSGRPAHRHLPRVGRRRPARQQDRFGGAHHAPADQHRRAVPERPLAAPQPRRGDGDAEVEALRARAAQAPGSAAEARGLQDRHRLGPPDPLVRARPVADQGPADQLRGRQHAGVLDGDLDDFIAASLKQGV